MVVFNVAARLWFGTEKKQLIVLDPPDVLVEDHLPDLKCSSIHFE